MTIKRISVKYLQALRDAVIELPEHGLIGFCGDNSNGKSIIGRTTEYIVTGAIRDPKIRKSLVNRYTGFTYCEICYERYDGMTFLVHIDKEAAQTWFELYYLEDEDHHRAYLSSKSLSLYVSKFGFNYDAECGISLNICDGDKEVLFMTTPNKSNYKILQTSMNDTSAQVTLERLQEQVKLIEDLRRKCSDTVAITKTAKESVTLYDVVKESQLKEQCERVLEDLSKFYIPVIPDIPNLPSVDFLDIYFPTIPKVVYPALYDIECEIPEIKNVMVEMESLVNETCPTCGRRLYDSEDTCCN